MVSRRVPKPNASVSDRPRKVRYYYSNVRLREDLFMSTRVKIFSGNELFDRGQCLREYLPTASICKNARSLIVGVVLIAVCFGISPTALRLAAAELRECCEPICGYPGHRCARWQGTRAARH